jgi:UDP-glucose 4-epimerase
MNIIVFGGGGFIGSAVVERFLIDGHHVRIFEHADAVPYREFSVDERVEWFVGDFFSTESLTEALLGMEVVVHLISATLPKSSNDDPVFDVQSNLIGSIKLLEATRLAGILRVVFISSGGSIYGTPQSLPIDESHPTEPRVSYGITKLAIEKYLLIYQQLHGIKVTVLRVTNPYGVRQRPGAAQGAVAAFMYKALHGQPIEIWGDGSVVRDYVYISDVAEAFGRAVSYDGKESIFNISTGVGTSLNQLVSSLEKVLQKNLTKLFFPGRPFDVPVSLVDSSLAAKELGWKPQISLDDGLLHTLEWLKGQP